MNEKVQKLLKKAIAPVVNNTIVRTGIVRLAYARLFKPEAMEGGDPKYSVTLLIPKEDTQTIKAIADVAKEVATSEFGQKLPTFKNQFIKDGDTLDNAMYQGFYVVRASTKSKPSVVKIQGGQLVELQEHEIKSGDWAIVTINIFAYNKNLNKGISAYLNNVMLVALDDALGGGSTKPQEDFADLTAIADIEMADDDVEALGII